MSRPSLYVWIVAAAALVMALRIGASWRVFNDVIDEPYHLGAGLAMYEAKRHVLGVQHPPLPRLVGALPLALSGVGRAVTMPQRVVVADLPAFEVGHDALLRGPLPYWSALVRARAAMLVFPIVAVTYVYLIGTYAAGRLGGCVAAVFFSTDPTLLGHGGLVTTDVPAAAGFLAATYHGVRFIGRPTWGRMLIAGLALGLALACKFSCALVLPALGLIWLCRGRRALRTALRVVPFGAGAIVVALLTLWATYGFDVGRIDRLTVLEARLPDDELPGWMLHTSLPMPTAVVGYQVLSYHTIMGHLAYLNGEVRQHGWWYYFLEALALKSPVALLVAIGAALLIAIVRSARTPRLQRILRSHGRKSVVLLIPFTVFLLASMNAGINIGIRHLLPAIPLLYLFASAWLTRGRTRWFSFAIVILAFIETAWVHPDYLAFFNVLIGGPRHGEKYLLDSNLDWGQDQWRLHRWLEGNARGRTVTLRLFGNPRLYQWPKANYTVAPAHAPPRGLFAISKNYLHDVYPNPGSRWLLRFEPVARIGYSINVYDLDQLTATPATTAATAPSTRPQR